MSGTGIDQAPATGSPQPSRSSFFGFSLFIFSLIALLLAFAPSAQAAPSHLRTPARDVPGLNHACGLAVDSQGDLYASSAGEDKVKVYDPSHALLTEISNANEPCGLAVTSHGDLLVSEQATGNVVMYVPDAYPFEGTPTYGAPIAVDASGEAKGVSVDPTGGRLYAAEGTSVASYGSETQAFTIRNATGGTYKLRFEGSETAPLPYNASNEEVQAALEALAALAPGDVAVTGTSLSVIDRQIAFIGARGFADVPRVEVLSSLAGNEVQKLTVKATAGTYKLRFEGSETAPIPFDAPAAGAGSLQEALVALANLEAGDVSVSGGPGDAGGTSPYEIAFEGAFAASNVAPLTSEAAALTGTASVATKAQGAEALYGETGNAPGGLGLGETQALSVNASGGTYTLSFEGEETAPLPYSAAAAEVQAALESLAALSPGDVSVFPERPETLTSRRFILAFGGAYASADVPQVQAAGSLAPDETQRVTVKATAGSFKLTFEGQQTAAIAFNASFAEVREALEALANLEAGDVSVTGGPGDAGGTSPYYVSFEGAYGGRNVPQMQGDGSGLGGGSASVATTVGGASISTSTAIAGWSGRIGEGDLTEASGVAAYTYKASASSLTYHLAVADAAADEVKLFSSTDLAAQKLRRTLDGPKEAEEFGFGTAGAHLAADPGTCPPAGGNACTAGHFFVYDDAHQTLDEFEASGVLVSQVPSPEAPFEFADAGPTAIAVDRSGGAGDGGLYVTAGKGAGARALAFGPLVAPSRSGPLAESQSLTKVEPGAGGATELAAPCGVAVDSHGNRYVADGTAKIKVFAPAGGAPLATVEPGGTTCRVAVDGEGNVYALLGSPAIKEVAYSPPSSYPPEAGTTYGAAVTVAKQAEFEGSEPIVALAVDPASDRLFATNFAQTNEYKSAKEGSAVLVPKFGAGLGIGTRESLAVHGASGNLYIGSGGGGGGKVYVLNADGSEVLTLISGAGGPGSLGFHVQGLTVDQSNGHVLAFEPEYEEVREFEASGTFVAAFGSFTSVASSFGVAVDNGEFSPNAGDVYVAFDDPAPATFDLSAFEGLGYGAVPPPPEEFEFLTVKKTGGGTGKVSSSPVGIGCGAECSAPYFEGTEVTLEAKADLGSEFKGWTGCDSEPEGKCKVTMTEAREVTATFEPAAVSEFPLTLVKAGTGQGTVTSSPAGISCGPACGEESAEFPAEAVTLTASPASGSEFSGWGLGECESEPELGQKCVLTTSAAKTVHAGFDQILHTLTVEVEGPGEVSGPGPIACGSECEAQFPEGETITLSATPGVGAHLVEWSGPGAGACAGSSTPSCEVEISEEKTVKAIFAPNAPEGPPLTVKIEEGSGTLVSDPAGIQCTGEALKTCTSEEIAEGTVVLTASPATGYLFKSWKGCDKAEGEFGVVGRQCTIDLNGAKTVGAKFIAAHSLTATKAAPIAGGTVSTSPAGINCATTCTAGQALYKAGPLTIKEKAAKHFHFVEFKGGSGSAAVCSGVTTETCPITIGEDSTIEALFAEDAKHTLSYAAQGGGQGSLKTKPSGINCAYTCSAAAAELYATENGGKVEIEVKLNKGTSSVEWTSGAGTCTGKVEAPVLSCEVTMSEDHSLIARFE